MALTAFVRRHPIAVYFFLAFALSWGGGLVMLGPLLARGETIPAMDPLLLFPVLVVGVGLIGLLLTSLVDGAAGRREFWARLRRWRVGAGWYAAALAIPPVLILIVLLALKTFVSPVFAPGFFPLGLLFGLVPGFFEELGWMGFVYPKLRAGRSALAAAIGLGLLWGAWHLPVVDYLGAAAPHGAYWLPFFLTFIALVAAIRVLIVWLYSNTHSLLLAQLLHASSTACLVIFSAPHASPGQETLWYAVYAAALWGLVALVAKTYGRELTRPPAPAPTD